MFSHTRGNFPLELNVKRLFPGTRGCTSEDFIFQVRDEGSLSRVKRIFFGVGTSVTVMLC